MEITLTKLKSDSHLRKKICFVCFNDDGNEKYFLFKAFYIKAPFDLKTFKVLSWFFGPIDKKAWLEMSIWLISKFMTSQPGYEIITKHIFLNISRMKRYQTIKFGQLIDCNKRNIFLQKSYRKLGSNTSSRPLFVF